MSKLSVCPKIKKGGFAMSSLRDRRSFLHQVAAGGAIFGALSPLAEGAANHKDDRKEPLQPPEPTLTVIVGKPRERGRRYGQKFKDGIQSFLDKEIYGVFTDKPASRDDMLRYAGQCGQAISDYAPAIHEEFEGIAEGSGLRFEEAVLITLHEELYHRGVLPKVPHCTAVAIGPPDTHDGHTYVGQTWDWMPSVFGLSSMLLWKRTEGPSVLAYAYPGLWVGAGVNSAGIALCWTSAQGKGIPGPRVGIPSYVLLTQLLYQETLKDALEEAKRAPQAGWFTFVLADGKGHLANVEGSPRELAIERHKGSLARVLYGSRQLTETVEGEKIKYHPRCQNMFDLLAEAKGKLDGKKLQHFFSDPKCGICDRKGTIDMMVFDTTACTALVSRGSGYGAANWKTFAFDTPAP